MPAVIYETLIPDAELKARGKVRDIYDLGDTLLLVATDRLSAFDVVFSDPIPGKGSVLTRVSAHWFNTAKAIVGNHMISIDPQDFPEKLAPYADQLAGRSMLTKKARPLPIECVVRGYLDGSAWKEYQAQDGVVCGHTLPKGLQQRSRLAEPIFTPATKEEVGNHDINISEAQAAEIVGQETFEFVKRKSIELYNFGLESMLPKGIVLGDTKFEFGYLGDEIILIDECMTPDSSRFWEADTYKPGPHPAFSFDKQFVRDYVESIHWNKQPPAPHLPKEIVEKTTERYEEIARLIIGG